MQLRSRNDKREIRPLVKTKGLIMLPKLEGSVRDDTVFNRIHRPTKKAPHMKHP